MKNAPNHIYLNIGAEGECQDFEELVGVSWCEDRINDDDLEYISVLSLFAKIDELKDWANSSDDYEKVEFAINILKNLLK
jgi:hypothetical protein